MWVLSRLHEQCFKQEMVHGVKPASIHGTTQSTFYTAGTMQEAGDTMGKEKATFYSTLLELQSTGKDDQINL